MARIMTEAQRLILDNIANDRPSWGHLSGRSEYGGASRTMYALRRRGWLDEDDQITQSGRDALAKDAAPGV